MSCNIINYSFILMCHFNNKSKLVLFHSFKVISRRTIKKLIAHRKYWKMNFSWKWFHFYESINKLFTFFILMNTTYSFLKILSYSYSAIHSTKCVDSNLFFPILEYAHKKWQIIHPTLTRPTFFLQHYTLNIHNYSFLAIVFY